jgi:hypothetical protein
MSDHLSPRKLPSSHSTMSNHLGLPFYLPFQTYQVWKDYPLVQVLLLRELIVNREHNVTPPVSTNRQSPFFFLENYCFCQSFSHRNLMIGILISLGDGLCQPRLCNHILSEFWNRVKHFLKLFELFFAVLDFLLLIRTLSSVSRLSLFRSSCLVGTRTLYTCSHRRSSIFLNFFEKSFQENSCPFIFNKKRAELFFVLPFQNTWIWDLDVD